MKSLDALGISPAGSDAGQVAQQKGPLWEARLHCERIWLGRFRRRRSAIVLNCLLDTGCGVLQVVKVHSRMEFQMRVEGQEPRLCDGWNLSRILQVKEDKSGPLAVVLGKIGSFGFQFGEN